MLANQIIGNGDGSITIEASLAAIDATLSATAGLTYAPNSGYAGPDALVVSAGDPMGDFSTGLISLLVAGPLAITVPFAQTVPVGSPLSIGGVSLADPGLPTTAFVTVVMGTAHGAINLSTSVSGGIAKAEIIGNGTGSVTVTASLAAVDATLAAAGGLNYTPVAGYKGADTLSVTALDTLGSSATASVSLQVVSPLSIAVPSPQSVPFGSTSSISGISIADAGLPPNGLVLLTLAASNGSITISTAALGGVTSGEVAGNGTSSVTMTAPLAAIDATLAAANGLIYVPTTGYSGPDMLAPLGQRFARRQCHGQRPYHRSARDIAAGSDRRAGRRHELVCHVLECSGRHGQRERHRLRHSQRQRSGKLRRSPGAT